MTDQAPEVLLGAFVGEGNVETFILGSGTVNPGDLVKLDGSNDRTVVPVASAGDPVIGVVQRVTTDSTTNTTRVAVTVHGKVKLTAWGPIASGAKLKAHNQHTVAAAVIGTDAVNAICGVALQTAACGDTIYAIIDAAW